MGIHIIQGNRGKTLCLGQQQPEALLHFRALADMHFTAAEVL